MVLWHCLSKFSKDSSKIKVSEHFWKMPAANKNLVKLQKGRGRGANGPVSFLGTVYSFQSRSPTFTYHLNQGFSKSPGTNSSLPIAGLVTTLTCSFISPWRDRIRIIVVGPLHILFRYFLPLKKIKHNVL